MHNGNHEAKKLHKYPHMFPLDIAIWDRFIDRNPLQLTGVDYDVKVGSGTEPTDSVTGEYARMQEILSKYRIDAVGYTRDVIFIIEVKPAAGGNAIGQIATYTTLYKRDFNPDRKVVGVIVTDQERPDMKYLTGIRGIKYYIA